jgi:hypothetical protein
VRQLCLHGVTQPYTTWPRWREQGGGGGCSLPLAGPLRRRGAGGGLRVRGWGRWCNAHPTYSDALFLRGTAEIPAYVVEKNCAQKDFVLFIFSSLHKKFQVSRTNFCGMIFHLHAKKRKFFLQCTVICGCWELKTYLQ